MEEKFKNKGIKHSREVILPASFNGEGRGRNKIDFVVDELIILELKAKRVVTRNDYYQVKLYLNSCNKELGIIVNFWDYYLKLKRVPTYL